VVDTKRNKVFAIKEDSEIHKIDSV
jgi:hypothetical protein